jgi:nicotinate-nucleotide adenylyltransferase
MKIALFGTSADPPTTGHLEILRALSEQFDHVAVWAADNPFKPHQMPIGHRMMMLRLLIDELIDPPIALPIDPHPSQPPRRVQVYPEFSHARTVLTTELARQRWPAAELSLVIGADLVPQLPRWYQVAQILQQVNLWVVPRQGYQIAEPDLQTLRQLGAVITLANVAAPPVSSSDYRNQGVGAAVPPSIQAYIEREHLYKWQTGQPQHWPPVQNRPQDRYQDRHQDRSWDSQPPDRHPDRLAPRVSRVAP